jgi:serine/threonine protein phosphatase PrpC
VPEPQDSSPVPSPRPQNERTRSEATQGGTTREHTHAALLLGSNYTQLGEVALEELPPNLAIGISCGRFPKGYEHVDPNEDAVFVGTDGSTTILVVADGHRGFDAAHETVLTIADITPSLITVELESLVRDLAVAAVASVARTIPNLNPPRDVSRTALTICAIRDNRIAATTIGDTACLIASKRRVTRIGSTDRFLGPGTDPRSIRIDTADVPRGSTVVVASDGYTNFVESVDRSVRAASNQAPRDAVEALIADAFAGGAGDNVAVAVHKSPA